jgi:hypothetical protein
MGNYFLDNLASKTVFGLLPACSLESSDAATGKSYLYNGGQYPADGIVATRTNMGTGYGFKKNVQAERFDGVNDHINLGTNIGNLSSNKFTFCVWINPAALNSTTPLFYKGTGTSTRLQLSIDTANNLYIYINAGTNSAYISANELIANEWNHIAIMYNAGMMTGYINGQNKSVVITGAGLPSILPDLSSYNALIGASSLSYFNGYIKSILFSNNVFTASDITNLYALGPDLGGLRLTSTGELVEKSSLVFNGSNVIFGLLPYSMKNGYNPNGFNTGKIPVYQPNGGPLTATLTNMLSGYGYRSTYGDLNFDGTNDSVVMSGGVTSGKSEVSIHVVFTLASILDQTIYYESTSTAGYSRFGLYLSGGKLSLVTRDSNIGSPISVATVNNLAINTKYAATVTFSSLSNETKIYLNGVLVVTNTTPRGPIWAGAYADSVSVGIFRTTIPLNGQISTLLLFDKALTLDEVKLLHNLGSDLNNLRMKADGTLQEPAKFVSVSPLPTGWYRWSDAVLDGASSRVAQLPNRSRGIVFSQTVADQMPLINYAKKSIQFDGVNDGLLSVGLESELISADAYTIFLVATVNQARLAENTASPWNIEALLTDHASGCYFHMSVASNAKIGLHCWDSATKYLNAPIDLGDRVIYAFSHGYGKLTIKNIATGEAAVLQGVADQSVLANPLYMGRGKLTYTDCEISELVFFNTVLTDSEIVSVEKYLISRYFRRRAQNRFTNTQIRYGF